MDVRPLLILGGAFLLCTLLMLAALLVSGAVGQLLWSFGGIGLILSTTALLTVGIVAGGTELMRLVRWRR
jgi:hypothetical protein